MNTTHQLEVFCPHCREALRLHFPRAIEAQMPIVSPRFDRTIENPPDH